MASTDHSSPVPKGAAVVVENNGVHYPGVATQPAASGASHVYVRVDGAPMTLTFPRSRVALA